MQPVLRRVGLSRYQITPHLLSSFGDSTGEGTNMNDVPVDAPPLSSDESDGPPRNADIPGNSLTRNSKRDLGQTRNARRGSSETGKLTSSGTRSRPRAEPKPVPRSSQKSNGSDEVSDADKLPRPKRKAPADVDLGSQHKRLDDIINPQPRKRNFGKQDYRGAGKSEYRRAGPSASTSKGPGQYPKSEETTPKRKFKSVGLSAGQNDDAISPTRGPFEQVSDLSASRVASTSPVKLFDRRKLQGKKESRETTPEESQRPLFKIPDISLSSFDLGTDDGGLVKLESSPLQERSGYLTSPTRSPPVPSSSRHVCPMCNEEVDVDLLENFKQKHGRMTLDREQKFCLLHKKNSAKATCEREGYPDIEWNVLDRRIARRYGFLREILEGGRSYYGDIFSRKVKAGQNKTLLKSEENLTPGYYGTRGLRAMSENIVGEFSSLIRKRAVQDRLVSARGHTAYVQSVLVPELAVRLIMEDMEVNEEEARLIMKKSVWVGELLNEEVADVVFSDDEDESSS